MSVQDNLDGYAIFEESGLIQFSENFDYDKIYLEYYASMIKINGQYQVPKIAFEALVEWIKLKAIQNRLKVSRFDRFDQRESYKAAKANFFKVKHRIPLSVILRAALEVPKFDIFVEAYYGGSAEVEVRTYPNAVMSIGDSSENDVPVVESGGVYSFISFIVGASLISPAVGGYSFQDNRLIGAKLIAKIVVNNSTETVVAGDFVFNSTTGTITRKNMWGSGDTAVIGYFKKD
jgi:hypothetical protein